MRVALFPLGGMPDKRAVRAEAERLGLPVAAKPDSQDICFVASGHYADTVVRLRPDAGEPGEIVDAGTAACWGGMTGSRATPWVRASGSARPRWIGASGRWWLRSIRRGGGWSWARAMPARAMVRLREVNWLVPPPDRPLACQVKLRAREAPQRGASVRRPRAATWWRATVRTATGTPALPAPGQACVFYDGARVLGGGFICRPDAAMVDAVGERRTISAALRIGWRRSSAVEQGNHNPLVGGSNPPAATIEPVEKMLCWL